MYAAYGKTKYLLTRAKFSAKMVRRLPCAAMHQLTHSSMYQSNATVVLCTARNAAL